MVDREFVSADRGNRPPSGSALDLMALLSLQDWESAGTLLQSNPRLIEAKEGVLHLMAQRNDAPAVRWLLERGADVNGRWSSDGVMVTPLHLAAARGHASIVRELLDAGADPTVRDSIHDSDPLGWAEYFAKPDVAAILRERRGPTMV